MVELTKEEAEDLLNYITQTIMCDNPEIPQEVINKLSEQIDQLD